MTLSLHPLISLHRLKGSELLQQLDKERFAVVVGNFANPDMVGHTGVLPAAVRAVEVVDGCLGRIAGAVLARGGALLITADHGNCEVMRDPVTGQPHTAHTTLPVPFVLVQEGAQGPLREGGALEDVAPTILGLLGIDTPGEMTGRDLRKP